MESRSVPRFAGHRTTAERFEVAGGEAAVVTAPGRRS
jgi:hypothetical protein